MPFYETVFMARQDLTEAQVNQLTEQMTAIIKKQGGSILKTEYWGLRNLAYRINKSRKAHYVLIESDAPGAAVIELERNLRLHDDVMRSLTLRLEEKSKGPSIIMDKSRDDQDNDSSDEKEAA